MMHLVTAKMVNSNDDPLFWIGNLAPDAIYSREKKDIIHFRRVKDREKALINLANNTNSNDSFAEGVLLHLFLDWKWDKGPQKKYFEEEKEKENWFLSYRREIALTSLFLYNDNNWSKDVWEKMIQCDPNNYGKIEGISKEDIIDFLNINYNWHEKNKPEEKMYFSTEYVYDFLSNSAKEYIKWRKSHKVTEM